MAIINTGDVAIKEAPSYVVDIAFKILLKNISPAFYIQYLHTLIIIQCI